MMPGVTSAVILVKGTQWKSFLFLSFLPFSSLFFSVLSLFFSSLLCSVPPLHSCSTEQVAGEQGKTLTVSDIYCND